MVVRNFTELKSLVNYLRGDKLVPVQTVSFISVSHVPAIPYQAFWTCWPQLGFLRCMFCKADADTGMDLYFETRFYKEVIKLPMVWKKADSRSYLNSELNHGIKRVSDLLCPTIFQPFQRID